jgi:hypothetical protein
MTQNITEIVICTHCNRSTYTMQSMYGRCLAFAIKVPLECVILKNDTIGQDVIFYDPDPKRVLNKRKELGLERSGGK